MRNKVWYLLLDVKLNEFFTDLIVRLYLKLDISFSIIIGIFSSGSIITWSIWDRIPIVWAICVGLSQIIIIISPMIGLSKSIATYQKMSTSLRFLVIDVEKLWYEVDFNNPDEKSISEQFFKLKEEHAKIESYGDGTLQFDHNRMYRQAEEKVEIYINKLN